MRKVLVGLGLLLLAFWGSNRLLRAGGPQAQEAPAIRLAPTGEAPAFARVLEPRAFRFPQDHGPHPDFQTEWWYYIGNLQDAAGERFGFQLTFFRRALRPGSLNRPSGLAASQIYFAHFALTDVARQEHSSFERFSRGAGGLAGARGDPFSVWLEDWSVEALDALGERVRLRAQEGDFSLDLVLQAGKPLVAHGEAGLSRKSEEPGNASYYLSFTRMDAAGSLLVEGEKVEVTGQAWFDHEWSTSALGEQAVGWDWFGLQLDDGREIMLARIRRADGSLEPVSGGTLVEQDGSLIALSLDDVMFTPLGTWTSLRSGATYPLRWRVEIPAYGVDLTVEPLLEDQEMEVSVVYWEGAVEVKGESAGLPVGGQGYIELTGYAESIQGAF